MSRFLFEQDRSLLIAASVEARCRIIIISFQQKSHPAPRRTLPDPWQLLISVCPSGPYSSQLLRSRGSLQINYKRLGNHRNSIWPGASGLLFDPRARLSVGTRISGQKPDKFSVLKYSQTKIHLYFSLSVVDYARYCK